MTNTQTTTDTDEIADGEIVDYNPQALEVAPPTPVSVNALSRSIMSAADTEGWDQIDSAGMEPADANSVPWLKMDRRLSKGFEYADGFRSSVELVMLAQQDVRAYFAGAYDPKAPATRPDCSSDDGITSREDSPNRQVDAAGTPYACADCPMSKWGPNNETPACSKSKVVMALQLNRDDSDEERLTGGQFVRVRFGGKALSPLTRYENRFAARVPKLPIQAFITTVELIPDPKGDEVLVPTFTASEEHFALAAMRPVIDERDRRLPDFRRDVSVVEQDAEGRAEDPFPTASQMRGGTEPGTYITDDGSPF